MALVLNFLAVFIGAVVTYTLSIDYKQGAVRSSALVGVVIGSCYLFFPDLFAPPFAKDIPYVMFGGSFIGMVSAEKHIHKMSILVAVLIFTLLYSLKSQEFNGLGGLLGITALISLIASVGVFIVIDKLKK